MADDESTTGAVVFLFGLCLFAGSLAAFVADLATGHDVGRSLAANAVGAVVLVSRAARDTLADPDSDVATPRGAAGTGLLLVGLYLLVAAAVVGATGLVHDRLELALYGGGIGVAAVAVGLVVYPRSAGVDRADDRAGDSAAEATDPGDVRE